MKGGKKKFQKRKTEERLYRRSKKISFTEKKKNRRRSVVALLNPIYSVNLCFKLILDVELFFQCVNADSKRKNVFPLITMLIGAPLKALERWNEGPW